MMPELQVETLDEPTEQITEEATEIISPTELAAHLQNSKVVGSPSLLGTNEVSPVHLDDLKVPSDKGNVRILVRPLTASRSVTRDKAYCCDWLELTTEVTNSQAPQQKVLAVTQTSKDIKFTVLVPGANSDDAQQSALHCDIYYDPASNNQVFLNRADVPVTLSRLSRDASSSPGSEHVVVTRGTKGLHPGSWRISVDAIKVIDFRILEKRPFVMRIAESTESSSLSDDTPNESGKRAILDGDEGLASPDKRLRADSTASSNDGAVIFTRPGHEDDSLLFPLPSADNRRREVIRTGGQPLLEAKDGETLEITAGTSGGKVDTFTIKKTARIYSSALSAVSQAEFSPVPESTSTLKILKTQPQDRQGTVYRAPDLERNLISQAEVWQREYRYHSLLNHKSIPRLYGADARFLSLVMQHIPASDLTKRTWQDSLTHRFKGSRLDAVRILHEVASALAHMHENGIVHNDIKPGNILYDSRTGAFLCDFGMSTDLSIEKPGVGGTPYYIAPEFINFQLRGAPGDVWALGVVMLYVFGKIVCPDSIRDERQYWRIADVNSTLRPQEPRALTALQKMQNWLSVVKQGRGSLNESPHHEERLVGRMLIVNYQQRITMTQVMEELRKIGSANG